MSIDSEVTSMTQNIQADYEGLENIGADLTGINKNILNIRTILDNIYNDLPKVSDTGTEVTLTPTRKGRLALIPKGNSIQESTTGKNILPAINLTSQSVHGVVFTPHYTNGLLDYVDVDGTWEGTGTNAHYDLGSVSFTGNESYSISGINGYETNYINLWTTSSIAFPQGNRLSTANGVVTRTALGNETCNISIYIYSGKSYDHLKVYPMICRNNTSDTYEPYTNGQAPNPSYPFPIKSVTGNNNVVVQNKNLLLKGTKFTKTSNNWYDNFGVVSNSVSALQSNEHYYDLKGGQQYTIKVNEYANVSNWQLVYILGGNIGALVYKGTNVTDAKTFTPSADTRVWFRIATENANTETYCYAQLELGSTATSYEEHKEQTLPLNLGTIELNKIGNYQDYIYKTSGKNLFDRATATENTGLKWADGLTYTGASTTGMIISDYINITNIEKLTSNYTFCIFFYDSDKTYLGNGVQVKKESYSATYTSITIPYSVAPNIYYARIEFRPQENNSEDMTTKNLMVNTGDTALPYEPYGSGIWYKKEEIGKVTITGEQEWNVSNSGTANWYYITNISRYIMTPSNPYPNCLSNYFVNANVGNSNINKGFMVLSNETTICNIRVRTEAEDTPTNFQNWVNTHNIIVYAPLLTAQDIEITDTQLIEQLNEIEKMKSYEGTTIITSTFDSNNAQMIISASGLKGE